MAFNDKHHFLLFLLNIATGGFILILLILIFFYLFWKWFCVLGRKIVEYTNPNNTLYNSPSSYYVEFFWKTGLLILVFRCDIKGRLFSRPCVNVIQYCCNIVISKSLLKSWSITRPKSTSLSHNIVVDDGSIIPSKKKKKTVKQVEVVQKVVLRNIWG